MPAVPAKKNKADAPAPAPARTTSIETLQEHLLNLSEQVDVLQNTADQEGRALTEGELEEMNRLQAEFKRTEREIEARAENEAMRDRLQNHRMPRRAAPEGVEPENDAPAIPSRVKVGDRVGVKPGGWGFRNMGEFAQGVYATQRGRPDLRIVNAPSTYGQEAVGADGGFAVPPDFRAAIMKTVESEESLLPKTDQQFTSSNSIKFPMDMETPWSTSGGVQVYWTGEAGTITASKPKLQDAECKAHKIAALVAVTDELLEDAPSLNNWINSKVGDKLVSALNDAIVNGNGVAKPMGLLASACKITAAAVSGQGAGTVVAKNISAMWTRLYAKFRSDAVWLINQDVEPQLQAMTFPGTSPAFPAYLPPGGFSASPYASLFGRPIIPIEACQTVGTEGDIILTSLKQYMSVQKTQGMRSDMSIHLFFDTDHTAFRFIFRVGGQSYWPAAIARQNGSNTLSPIITLSGTRT